MNNYNDFCSENESIIRNLTNKLDSLLDEPSHKIAKGHKSDALSALEAYKSAMDRIYVANASGFRISRINESLFDEKEVYKELTETPETLRLLARLCREKIISIKDEEFDTRAGKTLLNQSYCNEMTITGSGNRYYLLSAKGQEALKSSRLKGYISQEKPYAVLVDRMIDVPEKWNELYVRSLELLNRFYVANRIGKEYIIFTLMQTGDVVFGCEIDDSEEIIYTVAGIFDKDIDVHMEQLAVLLQKGGIDKVRVLVDSHETQRRLEESGVFVDVKSNVLVERMY